MWVEPLRVSETLFFTKHQLYKNPGLWSETEITPNSQDSTDDSINLGIKKVVDPGASFVSAWKESELF